MSGRNGEIQDQANLVVGEQVVNAECANAWMTRGDRFGARLVNIRGGDDGDVIQSGKCLQVCGADRAASDNADP